MTGILQSSAEVGKLWTRGQMQPLFFFFNKVLLEHGDTNLYIVYAVTL